MYTSVLTDATLFDALTEIDREVAATAQAGGCRRCPGRLDHADYPRKPRGGPPDLSAAYDTRTSFCCACCRKRLTPPSVRFLGTVTVEGVRFEVPARFAHLPRLSLRYARWDLSAVLLCETRTGAVLGTLYPLDKTRNADAVRRPLTPTPGLTNRSR